MSQQLKPYPKYKESGLPWLADLPSQWRTMRAKRLFHKMDRPVRSSDEVVTCFRDGTVTLRKNRRTTGFTESLKEIGYQGVRKGDLVIHAMDAFAGAVGVSESDGKATPVYAVCQPTVEADSHYYAYIVREMSRTQWIQALAKGIRERSTDFRFAAFADQFLPLPAIQEQQAIAAFIRYQSSRINRLIRAKQRLIQLLHEQKQVIINKAVTRGIDPNVKLKPSGIDWLGEIPEHWEVKRLKWVTRLQRGYDLPQQNRVQGQYPVVSSGGIIDTHYDYRVRGPGVVMGRYGSTDAVFYIEQNFWPHNTSLFVTDFQGNDQRWCYYLLRTISKADHASKSAVPGVDRKDLFDIRVVKPPHIEQQAIARHLDEQSIGFDDVIDRVKREIGLLREYRTRLISDVVTGKVDVRDVPVEGLEEIAEPEEILGGMDEEAEELAETVDDDN